MKFREIRNVALNESYHEIIHASGLTILVMPKVGYSSAYAVFAAKYGSIDTRIALADGGFADIPEGTAHFLEHKLFESEELDAFERFAKTGASANAYTSFDRTGYLFSCTENFKESLGILLDFVQKPYFTQETVEKEQGIIGQEIKMYKDVAEWEVLFNLLRALYHVSPVRIDIAGTEESIAQISAEMLYSCYNSFYNLNNMVLAVSGNATVQDVLEVADRLLKPQDGVMAKREFVLEPPEPATAYIEEKLSVNAPQFMLGYKEHISTPERTTEERLSTGILLDIIAGKSSPLYKRLLEAELINTSFSFEYFEGFGYACPMFGGESKNPEAVATEIKNEIRKLKVDKVDEKSFERTRRKLYGRMIMMYNDVDGLANELAATFFTGNGLFDDLEGCKAITLDTINNRLDEILDEAGAALSVILPV
ncbi:MAG: insulinase family protein [Clostridiales bacterium]|nr:insulinase family protein [Clostridiales bacterium]